MLPRADQFKQALLVRIAERHGWLVDHRQAQPGLLGTGHGLVALEAFKQSYASQTSAQIGTLMQSLGAEFDGLQQDMARTLAISATHLARQIVRSELVARPALVAQVAHEALRIVREEGQRQREDEGERHVGHGRGA